MPKDEGLATDTKQVRRRGPDQFPRYRMRGFDEKKAKDMALAGVPQSLIAKTLGVADSAISKYLQQIGLNWDNLRRYKDDRPNIKAIIGMLGEDVMLRVLHTYTDEAIADMTPNSKTGLLMALNAVVGTRYGEERLERGLSTENSSTIMLVKQIQERIEALEAEEVTESNGSK